MPSDFRFFLYLIFGSSAIVYGVFLFPPLTSGGTGPSARSEQAHFDVAFRKELAFCQEQPNDINCRCFAQLSGTILAHTEPKVASAVYADKRELARGQAAQSC